MQPPFETPDEHRPLSLIRRSNPVLILFLVNVPTATLIVLLGLFAIANTDESSVLGLMIQHTYWIVFSFLLILFALTFATFELSLVLDRGPFTYTISSAWTATNAFILVFELAIAPLINLNRVTVEPSSGELESVMVHSAYWNTWFEKKGTDKAFHQLQVDQRYEFVVDISAYEYSVLQGRLAESVRSDPSVEEVPSAIIGRITNPTG